MFFFSLFVFRRWNRPRDRTRHIDDFNSTDVITKERKPPRADGENLALLSSPPRSISIIIPTVLVIHPQSIFLSHDGSYLPQNVQPSASWQRAPHLMKNWAKLNTHGHSLAGRRPSSCQPDGPGFEPFQRVRDFKFFFDRFSAPIAEDRHMTQLWRSWSRWRRSLLLLSRWWRTGWNRLCNYRKCVNNFACFNYANYERNHTH